MSGEIISFNLPADTESGETPEVFSKNENNIIPLRNFNSELNRRARLRSKIDEGELAVLVKEKLGEHKTITIIGTATAIGLAIGGLYAVRKKRRSQLSE